MPTNRLLNDIKARGDQFTCKVKSTVDALKGADKADLIEAIAGEEHYSAVAIEQALGNRNISLGEKTIRKHRNKKCSCEEKV